MLPLLFAALAPQMLPNMSPLVASALGAGVGGAVETGDLEAGLLTGLGAFAGGAIMPKILGGLAPAAAGASDAATTALRTPTPANLAAAQAAGLPPAAAVPPPPRPANLGMPGAAAATPGGSGMFGGIMDFVKSPTGIGVGLGAMAGPALADMFKGSGEDGGGDRRRSGQQYDTREPTPIPRIPTLPGIGYQPGVSGEHDYGIGRPHSAAEIMAYSRANPYRFAGGGMLNTFARPNIPGIGPVRLAPGGLVSLAEPPANEKQVISEAVTAIQGKHPNPEIALGRFLAMFGEDALRQLVDSVRGGELADTVERFEEGEKGEVRGPGDGSGTDDMVPARMEDGSSDVLLSDGEYVLRKDAADALERRFGGGFLDAVNSAGPKAPEVVRGLAR